MLIQKLFPENNSWALIQLQDCSSEMLIPAKHSKRSVHGSKSL